MPATNIQVSYMLTKFVSVDGKLELSIILLWKGTGWAAVQLYLLCTAKVCPAKGAKRGDGVGRNSQKLGTKTVFIVSTHTHTISFLESESAVRYYKASSSPTSLWYFMSLLCHGRREELGP